MGCSQGFWDDTQTYALTQGWTNPFFMKNKKGKDIFTSMI